MLNMIPPHFTTHTKLNRKYTVKKVRVSPLTSEYLMSFLNTEKKVFNLVGKTFFFREKNIF